MSRKRDTLDRKIKRAQIRALMLRGLTASAIAKQTGFSYAYVKMIYQQEWIDIVHASAMKEAT